MNILQIVSSLEEISGPAKSLFLVATGMAEQGHTVTCAHFIGSAGVLVTRLQEQGIEVVNLGSQKSRNSFFERIRIIFRLVCLVHKKKIEVIHAHHWDADCLAFIAKMTKKMKIIITLHSRSYFDWVKAHALRYKFIFIPIADKFVCVSQSMATEFAQKIPEAKNKIALVYNAPAPEFFQPRNDDNRKKVRGEFGVADDEFLIGSVGNFSPFKGIIYLLEAVMKISAESLKVLLVGADYGKQKDGYERFLADKYFRTKIIFPGFRKDIPSILDALDLFVFPSLEEVDPIALSEAMARGKPVVATTVGGIPEKIKDGETGFLVPPADSEALAVKIRFCLQNRARAEEAGREARREMSTGFSFAAMIRNYEALYGIR